MSAGEEVQTGKSFSVISQNFLTKVQSLRKSSSLRVQGMTLSSNRVSLKEG